MKVLVTGGAGFIGSNFICHLLGKGNDVSIANFDKLTYAGNLENLSAVQQSARYRFVPGDIADPSAVQGIFNEPWDVLVNFAAETHVDRSIEDATPFLRTNVLGTQILLEAARRSCIRLFVHISTDEVYGSASAGESFTEDCILDPRSPYSASKAAADHLVNAYAHTYGVPAVILRCTNNYGPFQFPEKLIPLMICNAMEEKPLPVYGDGLHERDWLFVEDYCRAIECAMETGKPGETYNVSSGKPIPNLQVVKTILKLLKKPESLLTYVSDRPGHDRRYSLNCSKFLSAFGWRPQVSFAEGIKRTVEWYQQNPTWLAHARSGEYRTYYERHYNRRSETFQNARAQA